MPQARSKGLQSPTLTGIAIAEAFQRELVVTVPE